MGIFLLDQLEECNAAEHAHIALSPHRCHHSGDEHVPAHPHSHDSSAATASFLSGNPPEEKEALWSEPSTGQK